MTATESWPMRTARAEHGGCGSDPSAIPIQGRHAEAPPDASQTKHNLAQRTEWGSIMTAVGQTEHRDLTSVYAAHGIDLQYVETVTGPQVRRHLFGLPLGTRVARVVGLLDEVEMALGIDGISIERLGSLIAIDVPHETRTFVDWAPLGTRGLEFFAGLDLSGHVRRVDLAKAPHLLIAGSTGSGKSVAINAILTDWLTRLGPDEIRLHLIDPKRVELGVYRGLPQVEFFAAGGGWEAKHVVTMVETIMDQRFEKFERAGVRDIGEWNDARDDATNWPLNEPMPYQVLVVDEFADLMLDKAMGKDIERMIVRIAQLGRAAGVHMLLATQRPSATVFTGLIKSNVPGRWVFRVNSGLDSRIALDTGGAEALLGKGDSILSLPAEPKVRLQAASPSADDLANVLEYGALLHPDDDFPPADSLASTEHVEYAVTIQGDDETESPVVTMRDDDEFVAEIEAMLAAIDDDDEE